MGVVRGFIVRCGGSKPFQASLVNGKALGTFASVEEARKAIAVTMGTPAQLVADPNLTLIERYTVQSVDLPAPKSTYALGITPQNIGFLSRLTASSGALGETLTIGNVTDPRQLITLNQSNFARQKVFFGDANSQRVVRATGDVLPPFIDFDVLPTGFTGRTPYWAYDTTTQTLWASGTRDYSTNAGSLVQINPDTGEEIRSFSLTVGALTYAPANVVALAGKLYVTGNYYDGVTLRGRLFKVDAGSGTINASSADQTPLGAVASDGAGNIWVAAPSNTAGSGKLLRIDTATLATVTNIVVGGATFSNMPWITIQGLHVYVSDYGSFGRGIWHCTTGGTLTQYRSFGATVGSQVGMTMFDGTNLWAADTYGRVVRKLNWLDIATDLVTTPVNGSPWGLCSVSPR